LATDRFEFPQDSSYKFPPLEAMSLLAETTQSVLKSGSRAEIDLEELEDATGRVEAYLTFRDRKFDRRELNAGLTRFCAV
jgi:hypothetical protein